MDHTPHRLERPKHFLRSWFDVRKRRAGSWAFALNRITGLGLTVYLFLHLIVLSTLLRGEQSWDQFISIARSPLFLVLDIILVAGILFHGLNGVRVALVGSGVAVRWQKSLLWILAGIGITLLAVSSFLIFTM